MPGLIGTTLGPYRILEQIGLGGMATVYNAYQPGMDRLVALKVMPEHFARDPLFVQRFRQEARIIIKLEHRNIVPVYDFGEQDGTLYLIMRYLQAGTVRDILACAPLPLSDAARIVADVAAGLDYAHDQGIVHRDVKPSNILIDKWGHAYLTDFGLAKVLESTLDLTGSSALLGTPTYMAPEQTLGKPVTPQTDVYALGVMVYEMATGRPPYEADTPMAVALKHVYEPLPSPRQVNPALSKSIELIILKALAKEPQDRYPSAGELARALTTAVAAEPPATAARLIELAEAVAIGKGEEEVTYRIRAEVRQQESAERRRRLLRRAPWVLAGVIIAGLAIGIIFSQIETTRTKNVAAQTATGAAAQVTAAAAGLLGELATAQAAATAGRGDLFEPTVQYLQTRVATLGVAAPTENLTNAPSVTSTATQTPTRTPTQTPSETPSQTPTRVRTRTPTPSHVAISTPTPTCPEGQNWVPGLGCRSNLQSSSPGVSPLPTP